MRNTLAIARKELNVYFTTPMAWVMFCAMTVISSYVFIVYIQRYTQLSVWAMQAPQQVDPTKLNLTDVVMVPLLGTFGTIFGIIVPFLTMRLLAEERRQRTLELLMTTPVRPTEIVLGKFLAAFAIVALTLLFTGLYPLVLQMYGGSAGNSAPIEWTTILGGYLGLLCWGATTVSVGLFISSLTENQAIAAVCSVVVLLLSSWLGVLAQSADGQLKEMLANAASSTHLQALMSGEIGLKDLVYFASLTVLALFLTQRSVESQRWA